MLKKELKEYNSMLCFMYKNRKKIHKETLEGRKGMNEMGQVRENFHSTLVYDF